MALPGGLKKLINRETVTYVAAGIITTLVNWAVYYPLRLVIHYAVANVLAWIAAVASAFVINKFWVFRSKDRSARALLREIGLFAGARVASLGIESGFLMLTVELLGAKDAIMKLIAAVFVIVTNYIFSKFIIFKKETSDEGQ